ncbi:MAG: hypothetical protein E7586_05160 [Ruminococcaceae bacterium]|nr:hypothetical protein [Oscillospiraceae bacterium]
MASAFKNFFITFIICLLIFGFLGFTYGIDLIDSFRMTDDTEQSNSSDVTEPPVDDSSADVSAPDTSAPEQQGNIVNPDGDVFTAIVMIVDDNNRPIDMAFIDSNAKTERFVYCPISVKTKVSNKIGTNMAADDLFSTLTEEEILQCVSAMTGIETQYCLRFNRDSLAIVAEQIPGASIALNESITFINPAYKDYVPEPNTPFPDDYEIFISNVDGKVLLSEQLNNKSKIQWLLEYAPEEVELNDYNTLYSTIAKSLIRQFFEKEGSTKSSAVMSKIIKACNTNLTIDQAGAHLNTIFSYDDFDKHEIQYPSAREIAVKALRDADGSFN